MRFLVPVLKNSAPAVKNNKPFAFRQVPEHQIYGLQQAKLGQYVKLQDMAARNGFANRKPYDCLWVKTSNAWIVVFFYHPRKKKKFYAIEVKDFIKLKKTWKRKSIREEELMPTGLARVLKLRDKDVQPKKKRKPKSL